MKSIGACPEPPRRRARPMPGMALGHAVNFSRKTFAKGSCFFHVWAERPQLSCFYLSYHAIIEPQGFTAARACTSVPAVASHGIGAFLAIHEPFPPGCGLPCAGPIDQDSRHKMDSRHHVRRNGLSLGLIAVLLAGCGKGVLSTEGRREGALARAEMSGLTPGSVLDPCSMCGSSNMSDCRAGIALTQAVAQHDRHTIQRDDHHDQDKRCHIHHRFRGFDVG